MKKTELKIRVCGDPVLSEVSKPVLKVTDTHRDILIAMSRLMYEVSGAGLAAVQVGISEAFFVADIGTGLYKLINPKIIKQEGIQVMEEGCLSVPDIFGEVERPKKVIISGQDKTGRKIKIEASGLLARIFQHELDHLSGVLFIDKAKNLRKLSAEGENPVI